MDLDQVEATARFTSAISDGVTHVDRALKTIGRDIETAQQSLHFGQVSIITPQSTPVLEQSEGLDRLAIHRGGFFELTLIVADIGQSDATDRLHV